jgi:hypothetical protein
MRPRLSARLVFAGIGAVACLLAALALDGLFTLAHTGRWVDDHETPVLLFFSHIRSDTERRLQEANATSGDVEVILTWNNLNDLDLHCIDPNNEEIFYAHALSDKSGGALDVDRNMRPPYTKQPVEHIYWPHGRAPAGRYRVYVDHYARHGGLDPTAYQVTIKEYGRVHRYSGSISHGYEHPANTPGQFVCEFTAGPSGFAFAGLPAGFWRALLIIAMWAAMVTSVLCAAFLIGLHVFYRRVYRQRFLTSGKALRIVVNCGIWGGLAGALGQTNYALWPSAWLKWHPTWAHVAGLTLLAAIAGAALGGRVPHLKRGWAFLAGLLGGVAAGGLFFKVFYWALGESVRSEMLGRLAAATVIGATIGFMLELIVEEPEEPDEPVEFADAALDGMEPLSLRANRIGPSGKLRRAGHEPVHRS